MLDLGESKGCGILEIVQVEGERVVVDGSALVDEAEALRACLLGENHGSESCVDEDGHAAPSG